jgi:hypothetical protein
MDGEGFLEWPDPNGRLELDNVVARFIPALFLTSLCHCEPSEAISPTNALVEIVSAG